MSASESANSTVASFLATARTRWRTANEAEASNRSEGYEDLRFLNLDQWPDRIKQLRSTPGRERPCLTIDQIGEPFRQLTNKQRESRPAIHINPEDGKANKDTAEVLQGIIRAIEYDSDAQIAYATAFEGAVGIGWGYARLRSEFDGDGPDQNLIVDMIENPFSVYLDPGTRLWDRRDMRYAFVVQDIPKEQYVSLYGESTVAKAGASLTDFSGLGDEAQDWFPEGAVRVAEYYYLHDKPVTLGELDGVTVEKGKAPKGATLENERTIVRPEVCWCKINGLEILDGNADKTTGRRIPGTTIPIRPCFGQVLNVNGKRVYRGIVRPARDPQQMYNYQNSALAEELALVPKSKVIMAEGQDEGHEAMWETANVENYPYLTYKPTTVGDKVVGPPSVVQFTDPAKVQALVMAVNQAKTDLRSTTGWYDATDPNRKNADQSGRAILARKESQNQGSINYLDNFSRFITSLGKVMLEWIPEIYDTEGRIIRTLGLEDEVKLVMINAPFIQGENGQPQKVDPMAADLMQKVKQFNLKEGRYGLRVSPGTAYTVRKQEAADWQVRLIEANPALMQVFGDIAVRNMDGPGSEQIADRIERTIPPQIRQDESEQKNQIPPEVQQQVQQMQEGITLLQGKIVEQQKLIDTQGIKADADLTRAREDNAAELRKVELENAAKFRLEQLKAEVEAMKVRAQLMITQATLNADLAQANIEAETKRLMQHADLQVTRESAEHESIENDRDRQVARETAARKETVN
jgi:hypothetical protein